MWKFVTCLNKHEQLNIFSFKIPKQVIDLLPNKFKQRVWCQLIFGQKQVRFQAGLTASGNGDAYIALNAKRQKELHISAGDEMQVLLEEDNSTYGYPIPEEMQEIFIQMPESKHWFDKITPGKQRYILMFVDSVKSPLLRADRAVLVAQNLISCKNPKISYEDLIKKH